MINAGFAKSYFEIQNAPFFDVCRLLPLATNWLDEQQKHRDEQERRGKVIPAPDGVW